jgi:hypothetical protein
MQDEHLYQLRGVYDMRKGFMGPLGDDLPSIISIMLALSLFFSGVVYSLNTYNQKIGDMEILKGSIEIQRMILDTGFVSVLKPKKADDAAYSYGLLYDAYLNDGTNSCPKKAHKFSYLIADSSSGDMKLAKLVICTWKR